MALGLGEGALACFERAAISIYIFSARALMVPPPSLGRRCCHTTPASAVLRACLQYPCSHGPRCCKQARNGLFHMYTTVQQPEGALHLSLSYTLVSRPIVNQHPAVTGVAKRCRAAKITAKFQKPAPIPWRPSSPVYRCCPQQEDAVRLLKSPPIRPAPPAPQPWPRRKPAAHIWARLPRGLVD